MDVTAFHSVLSRLKQHHIFRSPDFWEVTYRDWPTSVRYLIVVFSGPSLAVTRKVRSHKLQEKRGCYGLRQMALGVLTKLLLTVDLGKPSSFLGAQFSHL